MKPLALLIPFTLAACSQSGLEYCPGGDSACLRYDQINNAASVEYSRETTAEGGEKVTFVFNRQPGDHVGRAAESLATTLERLVEREAE